MKRLLLLTICLLLPRVVHAQAPQSWTLRRYVCVATPCTNTSGNTVETATSVVPGTGAGQVQCNLAPVAGLANPPNPTVLQWDDPDVAGRACQYTDPGTGPLVTAAPSNTKQYGITVSRIVTNQSTPSAETSVVSFVRPLAVPVPPAPTGLRVVQ